MLWDSKHSGQQRTPVLCCHVPHHENIPIIREHAACGADAEDVDDAEDEPSGRRACYLMEAPSHPPVPWAGTSVCRWHCPPPTARRAPHPPLSSRTHPRRKSAARRGAHTPKDLAWRLRHNCTQWQGEGECCCLSVFRRLCMSRSRSHHASRVERCLSEGAAGVRLVRMLRHSSRDAICWLSVFSLC